jgi:hypothetical protein
LWSWGNDVLGLSILSPYKNTLVYWAEESDYDVYDIRVDFYGNHYDFTEGYDLATISKVWVTCPKDGAVTLHWQSTSFSGVTDSAGCRIANLLGEYDFSEDKLQDSVGIKPPKLTD